MLAAPLSALAGEGPRLDYTKGPAACLPEAEFRKEIAIRGDGADLFSPAAPDRLRVWFEKLGPDLYRGGYEYTDSAGRRGVPTVFVYKNCEVLGRTVATAARAHVPQQPEPAASAPALVPPEPAPPEPAPPAPAAALAPAPAAAAPPSTSRPAPPPSESLKRVAPTQAKNQVTVDLSVAFEPYAAIVASVGITDNVAPGFAVGVNVFAAEARLREYWFSFGAGFQGLPPSDALVKDKVPDAPSYGPPFSQQVSQYTGFLTPCAHVATYFVGCAVLQFGGIVFKLPFEDHFRTGTILAIGPRVGVEVPFGGRFAVAGYVEMPVNLVRKDLIDGVPSPDTTYRHWETPRVYGLAGVSFGVSFK